MLESWSLFAMLIPELEAASGIDMQWLTSGEAREMVPMLTSQVLGAAYAPQVGSISAPAMTRAYAEAASSCQGTDSRAKTA
jgi:L-2-hydroxyglutarate oxidase LhgO